MISNSVKFIILAFFLQTCTAKVIEEVQYTDRQILALSQDCAYVNNLISKGMKKAKKDKSGLHVSKARIYDGSFLRNDLLVKVLIETTCLNGQSLEQVQKRLGKPSEVCLDEGYCMDTYLQYNFQIEGRRFYYLYFIFEDDLLAKINLMPIEIIFSH